MDTDSSTGTDPGISACIDFDLGSTIGTFADSTSPLADDYDPSCAPGTRDAAHRFVAPVDGFYAFDTVGSDFDTVVVAYDGNDCDATEVACNDDVTLGDPSSRVSTFLSAGQALMVVVDGFNVGEEGDYSLDVDAVIQPCATEDLGSALPVTAMASTVGQPDRLTSTCAPNPASDVTFRWQAPEEGAFLIDTVGSSFDTVLYIRQGTCGFVELDCNDDDGGTPQSEVVAVLEAGEEITIVVDGFTDTDVGAVVLNIQ